MKLSIVATMYNSAPYIVEFYQRITVAASKITNDFEIILVNDGSPDHSLRIAHELYLLDHKVKIIELSRNFGHHKAIATGLSYAKGEYVFLIDSDLEEDPELILNFWDAIQADKTQDVIYGIQNTRKGHWFERWSGLIYYKLLNSLSDNMRTDTNISTVRLMKQGYVKALAEYKENAYYFGPISNLVGFNQRGLHFDKKSKSTSSYSFFTKYHIFLDSIFTFSSKPLYFIFYFGTILTIFSFLFMSYLMIRKIFWGIEIEGWTSMVVTTAFFGGINIFFMGILSVYVLHIFREVQNRPFTTIRKIHDKTMDNTILTDVDRNFLESQKTHSESALPTYGEL
jgi:putative glycosyltransferase